MQTRKMDFFSRKKYFPIRFSHLPGKQELINPHFRQFFPAISQILESFGNILSSPANFPARRNISPGFSGKFFPTFRQISPAFRQISLTSRQISPVFR
jgi:hypothetical protein